MEILLKLPLAIETPIAAPAFSTSVVGSPPGNKTKKQGVYGPISSYVVNISKGGYSINYSPKFSVTY